MTYLVLVLATLIRASEYVVTRPLQRTVVESRVGRFCHRKRNERSPGKLQGFDDRHCGPIATAGPICRRTERFPSDFCT
jgi:hypothetical protein